MRWSTLIDELKTRGLVADLSPEEAEMAIAVLATVMHADARVGLLERHKFASLVAELPFYPDKAVAAMHVESAIARATEARGEADYKAILDGAAVHITDPDHRREVFRMAAAMAYADHRIQPEEATVLGWLAAAFSIDDAEALLAQVD